MLLFKHQVLSHFRLELSERLFRLFSLTIGIIRQLDSGIRIWNSIILLSLNSLNSLLSIHINLIIFKIILQLHMSSNTPCTALACILKWHSISLLLELSSFLLNIISLELSHPLDHKIECDIIIL